MRNLKIPAPHVTPQHMTSVQHQYLVLKLYRFGVGVGRVGLSPQLEGSQVTTQTPR
ncbi:hypothetical protein BGZ63DRAFT_396808 [Mariannaea sp. PMI_226]|nr:hypothetical protein BGZ63DRAFT_396808 [Mariannaea sp. PMI_226]